MEKITYEELYKKLRIRIMNMKEEQWKCDRCHKNINIGDFYYIRINGEKFHYDCVHEKDRHELVKESVHRHTIKAITRRKCQCYWCSIASVAHHHTDKCPYQCIQGHKGSVISCFKWNTHHMDACTYVGKENECTMNPLNDRELNEEIQKEYLVS